MIYKYGEGDIWKDMKKRENRIQNINKKQGDRKTYKQTCPGSKVAALQQMIIFFLANIDSITFV